MHLESVCVRNYRRLRDVRIEIDPETSIFVGANNSGKTSAAQVLDAFLGSARKDRFAVHDFSAECWKAFDAIGAAADADAPLPTITLDLWFKVAP
ncbi:AAA family ATPase [Pseudoxanthomonas sp. LjRoot143]|uniref:AAA family ATPase n=1 Tax=Pseudoxanthomonas sp. LjRoot143 TaxID=3342266 RepID=UPI003ECDD907